MCLSGPGRWYSLATLAAEETIFARRSQAAATLVPGRPSAEHLRKLADKAVTNLPSAMLFEEGSTDSDAFYVLAGDVALSSKKALPAAR